MTLQRYGSWDELPISEIGEWVRLDDVVELLKGKIKGCSGYECENCLEASIIAGLISSIEGEK